nr:hypothetical protein PPOKNCAL_00728 [Escherichia coli]
MSTDRHVLSLKRKTAYARTRDKKTPLRGERSLSKGLKTTM